MKAETYSRKLGIAKVPLALTQHLLADNKLERLIQFYIQGSAEALTSV